MFRVNFKILSICNKDMYTVRNQPL